MGNTAAATIGGEGASVASRGEEIRHFEVVVGRCLRSLYRTAFSRLGNMADAEDAVQDALLSAYRHLDQFRGQAQMSTWLTTIVINCARMQLRSRHRRIHMSLDDRSADEGQALLERLMDDGPSPEDECEKTEFREHLAQLIGTLSPTLRTAWQLRDLDELTTREAANMLGSPEGTVKAHVARARAKLKISLRRTFPRPRATWTHRATIAG
jgi:RNA polymerase sigma-70 factor (ECF subfamily)